MASGCQSTSPGKPERGPNGTIGYQMQIEVSDPGARVEINDEYVGTAPLEVRVWGDPDGTFHNFGSSDYVISVFPVRDGQNRQTKVFRTGGWFSQEDRIPKRLYFDLNLKEDRFTVDPGKSRY